MFKFNLIPPWIKLAAIGAVLATSFGAGVWVRDAFCDAAAARAQLAAEKIAHAATQADLETWKTSALFGTAALEAIEHGARTREEIIREKQTSAPAPAPDCRKLDRAGLDWLRRIAPD